MSTVGLTEKDISIVNTSDVDWIGAYKSGKVSAIVAWNPGAQHHRRGARRKPRPSPLKSSLAKSSTPSSPNTALRKENPDFGKAIVGAWFEALSIVTKDDETGKAARESMGKASGTDTRGLRRPLKTTKLFVTPAEALRISPPTHPRRRRSSTTSASSPSRRASTVREPRASTTSARIPRCGTVLGSKDNINLRFDASFKKMAIGRKPSLTAIGLPGRKVLTPARLTPTISEPW